MKKSLIIIVGLVIVLACVMPYLTGRVAESASYEFVEQLQRDKSQIGDVSIVDYRRDYYSSSTKINWVRPVKTNTQKIAITLTCDGKHGVFAFSYNCRSDNSEAYKEFVNIQLNGVDPLSISGKVSIFGDITQTFAVSAFEFKNEQDELVSILPAALSINTDRHAKVFEFSGKLEGLSAVSESGKFKIGSSEVGGTASLNQLKIALGDVVVSVDTVAIDSENDGGINIADLRLNAHSRESGEDLQFAYQLDLGSFTHVPLVDSKLLDQETSEPVQRKLTNLSFGAQLVGMNMVQAGVLRDKWQALPGSSSKDNKASMLALVPEIEALLKSGLKIDSSVSADYSEKHMQAEFELGLVGDLKFGDFLLMKINPKSFFSKLNARLSSKVPAKFLELKENSDIAVEKNPLYRKVDGVYQSDIVLENAEVDINDKRYTLEEVFELLQKK